MLLRQRAYTKPPAAFDSDNSALFFFFPLLARLCDNKSYKHLINELAVRDMQSGPVGQKEMSRPFELCDEHCIECNN